jgi:hypothetical protein
MLLCINFFSNELNPKVCEYLHSKELSLLSIMHSNLSILVLYYHLLKDVEYNHNKRLVSLINSNVTHQFLFLMDF